MIFAQPVRHLTGCSRIFIRGLCRGHFARDVLQNGVVLRLVKVPFYPSDDYAGLFVCAHPAVRDVLRRLEIEAFCLFCCHDFSAVISAATIYYYSACRGVSPPTGFLPIPRLNLALQHTFRYVLRNQQAYTCRFLL